MRSNLLQRRRKVENAYEANLRPGAEYADCGVLLRVVERYEHGDELLPGRPRLRVIKEYRFGGILDRRMQPRHFIAPSANPQIWYCSERQAPLIIHGDDIDARLLVQGSMGSGKTTAGVQWAWFRGMYRMGQGEATIGITAPTGPRLEAIKTTLGGSRWSGAGLWPSTWWEPKFHQDTGILPTVLGVSYQFISTHKVSQTEGSRLQGFNWSDVLADELQDSITEYAPMESRLRAAHDGTPKIFASVTSKDSADWRDFKSGLLASKRWTERRLIGTESPFIHPDYWEQQKDVLTEREYQRMVLAMDVASEKRVYYSWDRSQNLRQIPRIGARDVTESVLRKRLRIPMLKILGGYDPGNIVDVTELLRVYEVRDEGLIWMVIGEHVTDGRRTEQHMHQLIQKLQSHWGVQGQGDGEIFIHADPYGKSDSKPDKDVFRIMDGMSVKNAPAQYSKDGTGTGNIKVEARISMVNRLLCNERNARKLFIACDDHGQPSAPMLVKALESMERDAAGNPEWQKKGTSADLSHYPAALALALWPLEKLSTESVVRVGAA